MNIKHDDKCEMPEGASFRKLARERKALPCHCYARSIERRKVLTMRNRKMKRKRHW